MEHPPKYPSTPHWPASQTVHRDDRVLDDPSTFVGQDVVITEKLDGANTCLWHGDVFARSTGQVATQAWFAMVRKHHAWKSSGEPNYCFYGEDLFAVHSIEYAPLPEDETYRVFAILEPAQDRFLAWDDIEQVAGRLGLPVAPVLFRGQFGSVDDITQWFRAALAEPSSLGGEREGFVLRRAAAFDVASFGHSVVKYVRPGHVQAGEHWTRNWRPCRLLK